MITVESFTVKNYKSIRSQSLEFGSLNVFIGGNGSGKSNLASALQFLKHANRGTLEAFVGVAGSESFLHFGRKRSSEISMEVTFPVGDEKCSHLMSFVETNAEGFLTSLERTRSTDQSLSPATVGVLYENIQAFHFNDSSEQAGVKHSAEIDDNRFLRPAAENLAAFLYLLKKRSPDYFSGIEATIRQAAPFFDRFQLEPSRLNPQRIRLEWLEKGSDAYFNAHSLSDGTLRFICLATLLLQPHPPKVILLDEPELGLHPAAIALLAEMLKSAAERAQLLVATQSVTLVNHLEPADLWVCERNREGASEFSRLSERDLSAWLAEYSLGELWEKNIIGGRP